MGLPMMQPTRSYFYPRPPRGGRLQCTASADNERQHFYPRPPRGGRHGFLDVFARRVGISIHALREEGDGFSTADQETATIFLSTPSARRATVPILPAAGVLQNFYPRPPRGGRPFYLDLYVLYSTYFYPRPPRGGRQMQEQAGKYWVFISIHALREEGD